jgi:hypothetical protein
MENKAVTITKLPDTAVAAEVREELLACARETGQVIVHCTFKASEDECGIRIWKSTYLVAHETEHKSVLVELFNISLSPVWTRVEPFDTVQFTLIFSGLPKDCHSFDLVESIPEPLPFHVRNIKRNNSDVYHIELK